MLESALREPLYHHEIATLNENVIFSGKPHSIVTFYA